MRSLINIILSTLFLSGLHNSFIYAQKEVCSFIVLTDLHVSPGAKSDADLNKIVDEINSLGPDFIIVTGDLSNSGSDAELLAVKNALARLLKPCYVLPGNHDTNWSESAGLMVNKLWDSDRFDFNHGSFRLIGFSTGPFMKMGDGHVKGEDIAWLKRRLSSNEGRIPVAFSHYPLNEGLDNWHEVTTVLRQAGCKLAFCGHGHTLRLYNFDRIPGIMCRSVILGKSEIPGYNIVELRNDSLLAYNKPLGADPGKPAIQLNYEAPDAISGLAVSPLPDYSINKRYSGYKVTATFTDSCSIFTGPCPAGNLVVYGNSAGMLKAVDMNSGAVAWQQQLESPLYSTPVYSQGVVITGTVNGYINAFNSRTGNVIWSVWTGRPVLAEGITDDNFFYIGGGDKEFYKIDFRTGRIAWKFSSAEGLIQGKPALSESSVFFGAWDTHFYCLDRKTGSLKWKWDNGKPQVLYSPGNIYPVSSGKRVFIVAPDRFLTALDETDGEQIWRTGRHAVRESMGVSPDGSLIYAKLMNDTIIAVSALKDSPVTEWKVDAGFGYEHAPCPVAASDREILAGTRDGVIIAVDPVKHDVIWKYKAGNSSVNRIVLGDNGMIWCSLVEGKIVGIKTAFQ
jgi:outer membrane protein assembly factor BamB/predicted phosphodiesterase